MMFGGKEGNTSLSDQIKVGDGQFFWGVIGGGSWRSLISTSWSRAKSSYVEAAGNHLESLTIE